MFGLFLITITINAIINTILTIRKLLCPDILNYCRFFYYCCYMYNIGSWSASTSPARSPSPSRYGGHLSRSKRTQLPYPTYGTTSLCQRSRSPSPARLQEMRERDRLGYGIDMGTSLAHCYLKLTTQSKKQKNKNTHHKTKLKKSSAKSKKQKKIKKT